MSEDWADYVDPADDRDDDVAAADEEDRAAGGAPRLFFGNVDEFVREHLAYQFAGYADARTRYWSPTWWESQQAISRLDALWRAWEHLRLDPATGMSAWWRDHADYHMRVLMDPNGPFAGSDAADTVCVNEQGHRGPLPCEPAPAGLFVDEREMQARP